VIGTGEVAEQRRLEGAPAPGGLFKVSSGLAAGERVVVDGQLKIKPGVAVTANEIALDRAIGGAGVPDAAVGANAPGAAPAAAGGAGTTPAASTAAR
jgi:hypothetical protein